MAFTRIMVLMWADILAMYAIWMTMLYLTNVWKIDFTHAAAIINIFWGAVGLLFLPIQYIIDSFIGSFWMLLISSISYCVGLGFLSMSTPPVLANTFDTCSAYAPECISDGHKILFYTALALVAVGFSGHLLSLGPFMAQQFTEGALENTATILKFVFGTFFTVIVSIGAAFAITYIKPWSLRYGIPAIFSLVGTLLFLSGLCSYTYPSHGGSYLTIVFRVIAATFIKIFRRIPRDKTKLYEKNDIGGLRGYVLPHSRRLSNGEPEKPLIVHVGRLGVEKSLDLLKRVMDQLPDVRIAFIGDGPYRGELEEMFKGMPAVFTGMLEGEELSQAYASGDIFVMPSESETLGLVVLEAMSSGLPVVTSRAGGLVDIIPEDQEGKTGLCFNPGEVEDCVKKVKALLDDKELRENMGLAAREEVGKYDWRAATKKIRNEQYNAAIWFWRKKRAEFFRPFQWLFRRSHRAPRISY